MIANPLDPVAVLLAGEDVEANLGPVGGPFRQLNRLVFLMVGRVHTADRPGLPSGGVI